MKLKNRLSTSTSPYLLQHQYDLIDWYPWCTEALNKAQTLNRPIFLSIGYSSCHWCHVQHHLTFQNNDIVELMNKDFVCIKVDKEQRPDIDSMFMKFVIGQTGSAGHPMSIFATPMVKPIFCGTYFDPETFKSLLNKVAEKWETENKKLVATAQYMYKEFTKEQDYSHVRIEENENASLAIFNRFLKTFDNENGGFSTEPKFPTVPQLTTLHKLGIGAVDGLEKSHSLAAMQMLVKTLTKMSQGGIFDYIEGGFHRYSVDKTWHIPHFEKMLYDQAQLLEIYSLASFHTKDYIPIIESIYIYCHTYLKSDMGGFYTAEDADSIPLHEKNQNEGAFAVWTFEEIRSVVQDDFEIVCSYFGIEEHGNVPRRYDHQEELKNQNILIISCSIDELANRFDKSVEDVTTIITKAKESLQKERQKRPRPFRDEKVVSVWNGMMASGLIAAYRATSNEKYLNDAKELLAFIKSTLTENNELWRDYKHNFKPTTKGFADDYCAVVKAYLDLYFVTLDQADLENAIYYQSILDSHFWDASKGGYFTNIDDDYIDKSKDIQDGAEPSVQTMALDNLNRLSLITDKELYLNKFENLKSLYKAIVYKMPHAMIGFSGHYITNYLKLTVSVKDGLLLNKLVKDYPTVITIDPTIDGSYIACLGQVCFEKQQIADFKMPIN